MFSVDTLPFGGVGTSGMGRYTGKFGFDTFTHEKAVLKKGFFGESLLLYVLLAILEYRFSVLSCCLDCTSVVKMIKGTVLLMR